ncbi:MAG: hypothetical protein ACHQET_13325 [Chitinophagales bacterium]
MNHLSICVALLFFLISDGYSQTRKEEIYTDFVLSQKRASLSRDLRERIIGKTYPLALDSNTEYKYESACESISQFLFTGPDVDSLFDKMFDHYDHLQDETRRSFLEAVYAVAPKKYLSNIREILASENDPKLFSICAAYLYRINSSANNGAFLKTKLVKKFPRYDTVPIVSELEKYLSFHHSWSLQKAPDISQLFLYQRTTRQKVIYSFQRWNRDYPGLAIIQNADGSFARQPGGKLMVFEQLARSGSDLPYFITNGSTPQGVFSIQGIEVAHNLFIGPTPNIQMIMPFESGWEKFFFDHTGTGMDSLELYLELLPSSWRNYQPMMESWWAGRIGRTEIIAHGTTIDPEYFKGRPFYPLAPTLGCLCAKELWNPANGHLLVSEQFNLVSAFQSSPGTKGYVYVINIDDQEKPVSRSEVEGWVNQFEKKNKP